MKKYVPIKCGFAAGGRNVHALAKELEREWPANLRSYTRPLQPGRVQSLFSSSWGLSAAVSCLRTSRICFPHVHNSEDAEYVFPTCTTAKMRRRHALPSSTRKRCLLPWTLQCAMAPFPVHKPVHVVISHVII